MADWFLQVITGSLFHTYRRKPTSQMEKPKKMGIFTCNRKLNSRISIIRKCILRALDQVLMCNIDTNHVQYHMLQYPTTNNGGFASENETKLLKGNASPAGVCQNSDDKDSDLSDLVVLKISLLGDCQIGKTSFLEKYVGFENEKKAMHTNGLNLMGKTLNVKGARISYSLWEVDGDEGFHQQMPAACKDSAAILIMFDLTSRVTLNGVIRWYQEARKYNQTAIPILVGTKFDDFIQLPIDLQWAIASQARKYAKALNATLFFSSSAYNINVNKIFKFITAKLFDLPWNLERNLTVGEPIIDF